uniref:Uncharacterized protein n=1 Tax=Plectus sambesii TaxID=2011161 RepID=A0A914XT09_9BILA
MCQSLLVLLCIATIATPILAQIRTCQSVWQTTNEDGTADTATASGTTCKPVKGVPAGTCEATENTQANAICMFSLSQWGYRCCYQMTPVTFATPAAGATFATLGPGTVATPRNLKPSKNYSI